MLAEQRFLPAIITAALFGATISVPAENWPGWRGPEGNGVYQGSELPQEWGTNLNVRWRVPLHSPGSASPVVWGDRVFVTQTNTQVAVVACLERATGNLLWESGVIAVPPAPSHTAVAMLPPPLATSATPVTDGKVVLALFGDTLACFDFSGNEVWLRKVENAEPPRGPATSPILVGELCIVTLQQPPRQAAFHKESGEAAWTTRLPSVVTEAGEVGANPESTVGTTPSLIRRGGQDEIVLHYGARLGAYPPSQGCLVGPALARAVPSEPRRYGLAASGLLSAPSATPQSSRSSPAAWATPRQPGASGKEAMS